MPETPDFEKHPIGTAKRITELEVGIGQNCLSECANYRGVSIDYKYAQERIAELEAELERLKDEWYSPEHIEKINERTIDPLRAEVERLRELVKKHITAFDQIVLGYSQYPDLPAVREIIDIFTNAAREAKAMLEAAPEPYK